MTFNNSQRIGERFKSWKGDGSSDGKNILIAKNVLNDGFTNINNINDCCSKYKFKANPIKHYRKQYVPTNSGSFSNNSYIGLTDKPGSYIISNEACDSGNNTNMYVHIMGLNDQCIINNTDKLYDPSLNRTICIASNQQSLVIKRANTKLDDKYCSSHKEYIYKKCKTFQQNLPSNTDNNSVNNGTFTSETCNKDFNNCRTTFNPSNRRYQVQGPVTSSSRIASLKYGCNNWKDNQPTSGTKCQIYNDYNNPNLCPSNITKKECSSRRNILSRPHCIGCPNDDKTIRRKRINILK